MTCTKPLISYKMPNKKAKFVKINTNQELKQILNKHREGYTYLPCRKCLSCKLNNAKEGAIRSHFEAKENPEKNGFITLTYSEKNIPKNENNINTIKSNDLKNFIKKIRKKYGTKIKYLASAEYGTKTQRPHYHICFFNLELKNLKKSSKSKGTKEQMYQSLEIDKIGNKGIHQIGKVNINSAGYTARYTLKKQNKINYEKLKIEPEKLFMSKGIGKKYGEKNQNEIYKNDEIIINGIKLKPPKYFDRLQEQKGAKEKYQLEKIKKHRQTGAETNIKMLTENEEGSNILGKKEKELYEKTRKLKRQIKSLDKSS